MKMALSLESQLDFAGPRDCPNHIFSVFFEVSRLSGLLGPPFFRFFAIFSYFGRPCGHRFAVILASQKTIQNGVPKSRILGVAC